MPENRDGYPILRIGMIHQKAEVHHTECKSVCNCRHVALAAQQVCAPGMYIDTFARHDISEGDDVRDGREKKLVLARGHSQRITLYYKSNEYEIANLCAAKRAVLTRILASAVSPATTQEVWPSSWYAFSLVFEGASNFETAFISEAKTIPSLARSPTLVPALFMASMAYST